MSYGVGIDIGTSAISVAIQRNDVTRSIQLTDDVSTPATAQDIGPAFAVRALAETITAVLGAVTEQMGEPPERLVLTCQARQGRYGRDLMDQAARLAGLDGFSLISDLEAAATQYAARKQLVHGDLVAVYALGANAFSVVVAGVTSSGVTTAAPADSVKGLGGTVFDEFVLAEVDRALDGAVSALDRQEPVAARALEHVQRECEQAKIQLSQHESAVVNVLLPYTVNQAGTRVRQSQVEITRDTFEAMIVTPLEATLAATDHALRTAGVSADQLAGVQLIGGSAQIPLVSAMLSTSLGRRVDVDPDPVAAVALGAAVTSISAEPLVFTDPADSVAAAVPGGPVALVDADPAYPTDRDPQVTRRRRALLGVAAAVLLLGGVGFALLPDSEVTQAAGPAGLPDRADVGKPPSIDTGPVDLDQSTPRQTGVAERGAPLAATTDADQEDTEQEAADQAADPGSDQSDAVPTGSASAPGSGGPTSQPPGSTATATPTPSGPPSSSAQPAPGLVIRVGPLCYDASLPDRIGQLPLVPCP